VYFKSRKETLVFNDVKHYLSKQFFVYLAKDRFYPSYNGKIGLFRMMLCSGAFNPEFPRDPVTPRTPKPPPPIPPTPPPPKEPTPKPREPECIKGPTDVADAAFDKGAIADTKITGDSLKDVS
jgi:hypothetical protein